MNNKVDVLSISLPLSKNAGNWQKILHFKPCIVTMICKKVIILFKSSYLQFLFQKNFDSQKQRLNSSKRCEN